MACSSTMSIMKEMKKLMKKPLDDIEVFFKNESNVSIINALMTGPEETPFELGRFEIELHFTGNYPQQPPKGYFVTKIFHPNVAPNTGEICVNTLKRDWKPTYGIKHILIAIRSLLIVPNYDSALNEDAGKLLLTSYDSYVERARLFTKIHAIPIKKKKTANVDKYHGDKENLNNQTDAENQNGDLKSNQCDILKAKQVDNEEANPLSFDENNQHNKNHKNDGKSKKKSKSNHKKKSKVSKSMRRL